MAREIERALAAFRRPRTPPRKDGQSFRATVDLRLSNLERQLDELKGRINGLLFVLAGAVATQVILRLFV
jgi:hypothetical protein